MNKFFRRKVLLVRMDGNDLASEDAIVSSDIVFTPLACDTMNRNLNSTHLGAQEEIPVRKHSRIRFSTEHVVTNATPVVKRVLAPAKLLQACGFSQQHIDDAQEPRNEYTLQNGTSDAAKVGFYLDGLLHVMTGCIGTCSLEMAFAQVPRWCFTLTGSYAEPADAPMPTPAPDAVWNTTPTICSQTGTPTFSFHGMEDLPISSFCLDVGNEVTWLERIGTAPKALITNRCITGNITIDAQAVADFNPIERASNQTRGPMRIVHQPANGAQITLNAPAVQLGAGITYRDCDGILQQRIPLIFLPVAGNDEFNLTTQ